MRQAISGFDGTLIGPEDNGYDAHREVWNAIVDRRPALIARCTSAADVAAAISYGREHDLEIAVKCGGHSTLGLSVPQDGLMIDLTPMDAVRVDVASRRAVVGGGALLRSLDRAAQARMASPPPPATSRIPGSAGSPLAAGWGGSPGRLGWHATTSRRTRS